MYIEDSQPEDLERLGGGRLHFRPSLTLQSDPSLHPVWSILLVPGTAAGVIDSIKDLTHQQLSIYPPSEAAPSPETELTHTSLQRALMDQEVGDEDDEGVVDRDQLVGLEDKNGKTFTDHVNCDLSDNSETEGEENDFYIDDSEPADLEGLRVVYDEEALFQYKHKDNDLEFEPNTDYYDELEFKFEDEETELEFSYEPGISLASLATCACPCLRHHETGHCHQIKYAVLKHFPI